MSTSPPLGREWWAAPVARSPLQGSFTAPGSKSQTARYLLLAAQASGPCVIRNALTSTDSQAMEAALAALGTTFEPGQLGAGPAASSTDSAPPSGTASPLDAGSSSPGTVDWLVTPGLHHADTTIDAGIAGTVMRFLPPLAATRPGLTTITCSPAAAHRPIGPLLSALRALGARLDQVAGFPLRIDGTDHLPGGAITVDSSASSQFISGLLLSGARFSNGVQVTHRGGAVPSRPHLEMTCEALKAVGVRVDHDGANHWEVQPSALDPFDVSVEPDLSTASAFVAAVAICGGEVTFLPWPTPTTQAGDRIREVLAAMGATCTMTPAGLRVASGGLQQGIDIDLHDAGELTPVVTALAVTAPTPSRLRGLGHIRLHETDRLKALTESFTAIGADITIEGHDLVVNPRPLRAGRFATHGDHRMVHAGALAALVAPGVLVQSPQTAAKTMPNFARRWETFVGERP